MFYNVHRNTRGMQIEPYIPQSVQFAHAKPPVVVDCSAIVGWKHLWLSSYIVITLGVWKVYLLEITPIRTNKALKKRTTIMVERVKFSCHENAIWRRPPYCILKNFNISALDEDISTKFSGQVHHGRIEMIAGALITVSTTATWLSASIDCLSDDYNF